jgi:hypothetical protein
MVRDRLLRGEREVLNFCLEYRIIQPNFVVMLNILWCFLFIFVIIM